MKRILTITAALIMTASVWAQSPEKMSYQAVIRNANNGLVTTTPVGMQISILKTTATGTAVYVETQTPTTNINGLISLEIGTGTVVSGTFSSIDWASGIYFIKTETDPTGGKAYTITGTSQLMSVPYALHAKTAGSITGTINYTETDPVFGVSVAKGITALDTANWNIKTTDTHLDSAGVTALGFVAGGGFTEVDGSITNEIQSLTVSKTGDTLTINGGNSVLVPGISLLNFPPAAASVGDFRDGGVVFWLDGNGGGLVVDMVNLANSKWGCNNTVITGADGSAIGTGAQNTIDIEAGCTTTGTAADLCANSTNNGHSDWFLPSKDELIEISSNLTFINQKITTNSGTAIDLEAYWSSTEHSSTVALNVRFDASNQHFVYTFYNKDTNSYRVRAVRAF